ncbi:MAG: glycosyltransferase family 39 protein [Thermoflexales bacterium]|nr:glycosyltransferase family 39 protein [Thermoflexales bacterium]
MILVVLLALAIRSVYACVAAWLDPFLIADPLHGDAGSYDLIARNLLAGHGFGYSSGVLTTFWPPLYPAWLAGLYSILGYNLLAARLAQAFWGAVAAGAVFEASRRLLGEDVGGLAGLGMALYPYQVYFGAWLIAEAMYMALLVLVVLAVIMLQERCTWVGFAGLGGLLGLGILAKPATLMLVPFLVLWIVLSFPFRPLLERLGYGLIVLLVLGGVVLPWTVRNWAVFRSFVLVSTNGGYTFYGANNAQAFGGHREGFPPHLQGLAEPEADKEYYRLGMEWIRQHPADFARLAGRKLARLVSPLSVASYEQDYPLPYAWLVKGVYWAFLLLALGGAALSLPRWRELFVFYALIGRVLAGTIIFYGDVRYTLPMAPALLVFASIALMAAWARLGRIRGGCQREG